MLRCSHFQPAESTDEQDVLDVQKLRPKKDPFPCVIYCHGNAGSRVDALPLLPILLPHGVSVCSFDFSGAGQSEGQYLSLGYFEREDLRTVVEFLKSSQRVSRIGLWGHSRYRRVMHHSSQSESCTIPPSPSHARFVPVRVMHHS